MGNRRDQRLAFGTPVETPEGMTTGEFTAVLDEKLAGLNTTYLTFTDQLGETDVYLVIADTVREIVGKPSRVQIERSADEKWWARDLSRLIAELELRTFAPHLPPTWHVLVDYP